MANKALWQCVWALAALTLLCSAEPPKILRSRDVNRPSDIEAALASIPQNPLPNDESLIERVMRERKHSAKAKYYTYDNYWLGDIPNITFTSDETLEYSNFGLVNARLAHEKGFLHSLDLDCAASKPNALMSSVRHASSSPSVIHSNATALAASGLSELFDVVAFTWKPLGPAPFATSLAMNAWKIFEEKDGSMNATIVDSLATWWLTEGYLPADTLVPSDLFGPWGEGVNFLEIESRTEDEGGWDFCLDNLVLLFHAKKDDE